MATIKGGSIGLGVGAILWGLLVIGLGLTQTRILVDPPVHWIIQILHLLLGIGAIALSQMIAVRYKRTNQVGIRA